MLVDKPEGNYRFLPGTGEPPFCNAVLADAGYEIVRATLERPLPYREGFELIDQHLKALSRPRQALCGLELRCREPYTPEGFRAFNLEYAALLTEWGLYGGAVGTGTTARTNIAPALHAPAEQVLFAFAYTVPSVTDRPTFVVSGATGGRVVESPDADRQRVANIVQTLSERLEQMGVTWEQTTETVVYAPQDIGAVLREELLPRIGSAVLNGIRWFPGRAPVAGSEIELGTHGVLQELRIPVLDAP
jgi:hypothetical protein